jgi:arginine/lysine/ornithine decarboxylase
MVIAELISNKKVLIADNLHRSAIDGCVLADIQPEIVPADSIADLIDQTVGAVFVTSPDYYGKTAELEKIASKCRAVNAIFAVDEAHGAHLAYIGLKSASQIADISVHSMHKTMGALTQSATVCINNDELLPCAKYHRRELCTSSPSFIMLESMEWASNQYTLLAKDFLLRVSALRSSLCLKRISALSPEGSDPTRLCVTVAPHMSGYYAADFLKSKGIIPEMADNNRVVLILTPHDGDYAPLIDALQELDQKSSSYSPMPPPPKCSPAISMRRAALSKKKYLPVSDAVGRISAISAGAYPPGIPCIYPGYTVTAEMAAYLSLISERCETFGLAGGIATVED